MRISDWSSDVCSSDLDARTAELAKSIADALAKASKPLIVSGTGAGSAAVMQAAANIAWALKAQTADTGLVLTLPEANSFGLEMLDPKTMSAALAALDSGAADPLVVLEHEPSRPPPP